MKDKRPQSESKREQRVRQRVFTYYFSHSSSAVFIVSTHFSQHVFHFTLNGAKMQSVKKHDEKTQELGGGSVTNVAEKGSIPLYQRRPPST